MHCLESLAISFTLALVVLAEQELDHATAAGIGRGSLTSGRGRKAIGMLGRVGKGVLRQLQPGGFVVFRPVGPGIVTCLLCRPGHDPQKIKIVGLKPGCHDRRDHQAPICLAGNIGPVLGMRLQRFIGKAIGFLVPDELDHGGHLWSRRVSDGLWRSRNGLCRGRFAATGGERENAQ